MQTSSITANTVLSQHPVGRFLDAPAQAIISAELVPTALEAGETLLEEGTRPSALYLLSRGQVDVYKSNENSSLELLTTLKAPLLLGEVSFLLQQPCSATVRARDKVMGWTLSRKSLQMMLSHHQAATSGLLFYLGATLAERLRAMNDHVMRLKSSAGEAEGLSLGELEGFADQWHGEFMLTEEVEPVRWEFGSDLDL